MRKTSGAIFAIRVASAVALAGSFTNAEAQSAPQMMDYFTATPTIGSLSSTCWGAAQVGPRDQSNGLEDKTLAKWVYWDGGIIKGPDGTYHMFSSRWDQSNGHNGWMCCSYAVHSTSNNLYGPYTDKGTFYAFDSGKGHNVTPFLMADGQYGVSISGVRPARVFTASSLDGPWTDKGDVVVNGGMCTQCNAKIMYRPDGQYEIISSEGKLALSSNVAGPYTVQGSPFYSQASSVTDISKLEDPSIWYSGGQYHWVTNQWAEKRAFHFTSADGIKNWKLQPGYAYDPTKNFVRNSDGTVNHWAHVERPEVYIENGHVVAFSFAAINVDKDKDVANDMNGSKVIVVPFDGLAFDSGGIPGSASGGSGGSSSGSGRGGTGGVTSTGSSSGGSTTVGRTTGSGTGGYAGSRSGTAGTTSTVSGSGGNTGVGGTGGSGTSGNAGTGGRSGAVGNGGTGVVSGLGGTSGTGGISASDGRGGTVGTGGLGGVPRSSGGSVPGSGGSAGAAGGSAGGSAVAALGGTTSHGGASGSDDKSSGCACAVGEGKSGHPEGGIAFLLGLSALAFTRRRLRRSRARADSEWRWIWCHGIGRLRCRWHH
jgi:MYXO-CTERM domain-containing protein